MKKIYTLLAAAAVAVSATAWETPNPLPTTLYLIGDPLSPEKAEVPDNAVKGNPDASWSPMNGIPMAAVEGQEGVFEVSITILAQSWFAFHPTLQDNEDWDTWNAGRYTPAAGGAANAGANPMAIAGNPDSWNIGAGEYKFTVDTKTGIFTVGGNVVREMGDLYLRGGMNDWGTSDEYKFSTTDENVYTLTVPLLEAGVDFKIANANWSFEYVVSAENAESEEEVEVNQHLVLDRLYYVCSDSYNMCMEEDQTDVLITLNIEDETVIFTKDSGISNVNVAEEGEAVYYNLQGVRVANPENGLFIQVKGGKAAKVVR